jgi:hypothetical protein
MQEPHREGRAVGPRDAQREHGYRIPAGEGGHGLLPVTPSPLRGPIVQVSMDVTKPSGQIKLLDL